MKAGEFCKREVIVVERHEALTEAARLMKTCHVGCVVVVEMHDDGRRPVGILTDRDIVLRYVSFGLPTNDVVVSEAMTSDLVTLDEEADLMETVRLMRDRSLQRLPVIDARSNLIGLVARDDAIELLAEELTDLVSAVDRRERRERQVRGRR
jgi:CBS domain-containing protein